MAIRSRPFRPRVSRHIKMAPRPAKRPGFLLRLHRVVKEVEPWGILVAVVALVLSLSAFWIDYSGRVEERTVRAWQLLTTRAPGNSGKIAALEYLNSQDGLFCGDDGCLLTLKRRTPLVGIDLSSSGDGQVYLDHVRLRGGSLTAANLSNAYLLHADLRGAYLKSSNLTGSDLRWADLRAAELTAASLVGADLNSADLAGASLAEADLTTADLTFTELSDASLWGANLSSANLMSARNLTQEQLDPACGDADTKLPEGLSIKPCP